MARKKKVEIPEEIEQIINIVKDTENKDNREIHEMVNEMKAEHRKGEWDVPIDQEILYFDSRLSYELTGYKPINDTQGLDFNPEWFQEAKRIFKDKGRYCQLAFGTKSYNDFWQKEYERCRDGMTVNGYTITGDHYYFLNYYRLEDLTSATKAGGGRLIDFPQFFVAQYEYFHYIELCKRLRKDAIGLKARGVGFSEIAACIVANTYNCRKESMCVIAAQQENYVSKTMSKVNLQLDFCNEKTDRGFFKLRQKKNTELNKRASMIKKIDGQDVETGWMSEINAIIADKPNKIRGDRTDILLYEESGSWPNWKKAYIQGEALVGIQGSKFGIRLAWGTGGDAGPALEGLADAYEHPEIYDALPYKHCFTPTGEETITAYFIPAYAILNKPGYIDKRGYCNYAKAKEYFEKERLKKLSDKNAYVIYCAEYCFTADEALALEGTNKFNKILIAEQIAKIRLYKEGPEIENGDLQLLYKNGKHDLKNISGVRWVKSNVGNIHIIEKPLWEIQSDNESYKEMRNLYVAGIDGIDIGQEQTSEFTKDPSKFCIVIKKRQYGLQSPKYVAYYMLRPDDIRDAYKAAIKLMMYYNCICNIEATRLSFWNWCKNNGWAHFFMRRPRATYPETAKKISNSIGTPATKAVIDHQTDLIAAYVEDYCSEIWFPEILDQLNRYTDENKGKFDLVAAMGMAELADEELSGVVPTQLEPEEENQWQDIGWYIDEYGRKRHGVIPKQKPNILRNFNQDYDGYNGFNRTSDPRCN